MSNLCFIIYVRGSNCSLVSKHSRAARRNEIDEPEAKSLAALPRAEKTDLTSAIIRATTKKNEDLLNNKMKKKEPKTQIQKDEARKASNLSKLKMEKAIMQNEILQDKILKSKQRSKYVQTSRKQNWDAINQSVNELKASRSSTPQGEEQQFEERDPDAMEEEDKFYSDEEQDNSVSHTTVPPRNAFDLLNDEVEA